MSSDHREQYLSWLLLNAKYFHLTIAVVDLESMLEMNMDLNPGSSHRYRVLKEVSCRRNLL